MSVFAFGFSELRDGITRVSSEVLGSLRTVWQVVSQVAPNSVLPLVGQGSEAAIQDDSEYYVIIVQLLSIMCTTTYYSFFWDH